MIKIYNYVINYKVEKISTECHYYFKTKTFDEILNEHINVTKKSK